MIKVIMISGKSASGKDTFAQLLKEEIEKLTSYKVLIIHFGDLVKYFAKTYYNWNGEKDVIGRALLQDIGTEMMRTKFPTYWAEVVSKFITADKKYEIAIIPDWRFKNELETVSLYNENITTIRINRFDNEGKPYYNSNMRINQLTHISECELDNFNFEWIVENRNLEELKESANYISEHLEGVF